MSHQANMRTDLTVYSVFQDFGVFALYDPKTEILAQEIVVPPNVEGLDEERGWFNGWCRDNLVDPIFEN